MRSHTGGLLTFGRGIIHGKSSKQKLNVKSSTEAEIVGVSEYLPYTLWLGHFLEAQGYKLKNNIVHQDNQSAMKLKKMEETPVQGTLGTFIYVSSSSKIG